MNVFIHIERVVALASVRNHPVGTVAALVSHIDVFNCVETEAVQTEAHPIQRNFEYSVARCLIVEVEFGHRRAEARIEIIPVRVLEPLRFCKGVFQTLNVFFVLPSIEIAVIYFFRSSVGKSHGFLYKILRFDEPRV